MRRALLSVVAACVAVLVAAAIVSRTAGFRRLAASLLTETVRKHTGRALKIGRLPVLNFGLAPVLVAEDVALSGGVGSEQAETLRAKRIELHARLLPLLHRRFEIQRLAITGLDVVLDTTGGPESTETPKAATPAPRPPLPEGVASLLAGLDVGELLITDSSLTLCDHGFGRETRVTVDHLRFARARTEPANLEAEVVAAFDGIPVSLSGTVGGPAALVSATEPFPVDVMVRTDGATVGVAGRITKVWSLKGVDLSVHVEVTDPAALGRALGAKLAGGGPWRVEGRLRDVPSGYEVDPLTVTLGGSALAGSVRVQRETGASLKLSGSAIELAPLLAALGVRAGVSGRVGEFAADAGTKGGSAREWVGNLAGRVRVGRGKVVLGGGTRIEVQRADVKVEAGELVVQAAGSVREVALTVSGTFGSVEELAFGGKPFPVDVVVRSGGTTVGVKGSVDEAGTSLKVSGSGIELAPLLAALGVRTDVTGGVEGLFAELRTRGATPHDWVVSLEGQAHITRGSVVVGGGTRIEVQRADLLAEAGALGVRTAGSVGGVPLSVSGTIGGVEELAFGGMPVRLRLVVGTDGSTAAIHGTVGRVWALRAVDVGVRAEVDDPVAFGRALGARFPGGGPWLVEGRVTDAEHGFSVEPLQVILGGNTLIGSMRLVDESGTSLELSGRGVELAPLLAALGVKGSVGGRVGEFAADVRTRGRTPRDWVTNLSGQARAAHARLVAGGDTGIEVEFAGLTAQSGGRLGAGAVGAVRGVPLTLVAEVGTIEAVAFGSAAFPAVVIVGTDGATVGLEGQVVRLLGLRGADVGVRVEVTDPAALGCVLGVALPRSAPLRVHGRFRDTGAGYEVDPLMLAFAGNTVTGRVGIDPSGARPTITVELSALALDLSDLFGTAQPEEAQAGQAPTPQVQGPVFSRVPLALHALEAADGRASLSFDDVALSRHAVAGTLFTRALLTNGGLVVEPIVLRSAGGTIAGSVRLDASGGVSANLTGSEVELGALLTALGGTGKATGGATSLRLDVRSTGHSLHEWMANLAGSVRIVVGPGRLEGKKIDLGFGVMSKLVEVINPSQKEDKHTNLRCAVANATIEKGVVDLADRVVIETDKFTAIASGKVDLERERLDVDVYARSSPSLSAGLSNFSGVVHMGGPLHAPSFTMNARGATTTALSVGTAWVTFGLSIIGEEMMTKMFTKAHCKDALAEPASTPGSGGAKGQ